MATSYYRGHPIRYDHKRKQWVYISNDKPITQERPCVRCGILPTPEGYDACLGKLPDIESACCGHGVTNPIMIKEIAHA